MSDRSNRFILQAIDPDHGCPVLEALFVADDLADLRSLLAPLADDDAEMLRLYVLKPADVAAIRERFAVKFDPGGRSVQLTCWHHLRDVPYLVHTNFELFLLLEGRKKFAVMGMEYPPHEHWDEALFDRHVARGTLVKHVELQPFPAPRTGRDGQVYDGYREVCYAPPAEEWRIPAWKLIAAAHRKTGWNKDFERLEGMLFGYEEWQIDWWVARLDTRFPRSQGA